MSDKAITDSGTANTLESVASQWDLLAAEADEQAKWDSSQGFGDISAYWHKAKMYRDSAKAIRMEIQTGLPHCSCCLKPRGSYAHVSRSK